MQLLRQQSDVLGEYIGKAEKGKHISFGSVEATINRPDLYTLIPKGGGIDLQKAIKKGYTDEELGNLGASQEQIDSARMREDMIAQGVLERHYIDPVTMNRMPSDAPT
jgi:hypothetical protein